VRVNDRGEFDGQLWIAMDFVDGMDAARLLNRFQLNHIQATPQGYQDFVNAAHDELCPKAGPCRSPR
jgi:hypothetical protein